MPETVIRFHDRTSDRFLFQHYDADGVLIRVECRACLELLPANRFRPDSRRKSGRRHCCRKCSRQAAARQESGE